MRTMFKKAALGLALGATALTAAAPAEAQRYHGRHYRHHDSTGPAIVAGIAGLAIGAAIASSGRDRDYDRRYYDGYYDRGYYPRAYYRDYRPRCYTTWRYDPYWGGRERVRVCR